MKNRYLVNKSELVRIETPKVYGKVKNLIGKYYLHRIENEKDFCFYKITDFKIFLPTNRISLFTAMEGKIYLRKFHLLYMPSLYEMQHTNKEVLFNVF